MCVKVLILIGLITTASGQRCWFCEHTDFAQSSETGCTTKEGQPQLGTVIDCPTPSTEFLKNVCRTVTKGDAVFMRDCQIINRDDSSECFHNTASGDRLTCSYCETNLCNGKSRFCSRFQVPALSLFLIYLLFNFVQVYQ